MVSIFYIVFCFILHLCILFFSFVLISLFIDVASHFIYGRGVLVVVVFIFIVGAIVSDLMDRCILKGFTI